MKFTSIVKTIFFSLILSVNYPFATAFAQSSPTDAINITVKVSVCGNDTVESGEDCDNHDLRSKNCVKLGYKSGHLTCDASCSFDTSGCDAPDIDPDNVDTDELPSLLAVGYVHIPSGKSIISTPSLTTSSRVTIQLPAGGGKHRIILPNNLLIKKVDETEFDPTTLTVGDVSASSISGLPQNTSARGVLQWGMADSSLQFDSPISVSIFVGTAYNQQVFTVIRSVSLDSSWTTDGIVPPATCTVIEGLCHFQSTKASYFAVLQAISGSSSTDVSSGASSNATTTTTTTSTGTNSTLQSLKTTSFFSIVPPSLKFFDVDSSGKLEIEELFKAVKNWIDEWKSALMKKEVVKCDLDYNKSCDLKDLSILLFYIGR